MFNRIKKNNMLRQVLAHINATLPPCVTARATLDGLVLSTTVISNPVRMEIKDGTSDLTDADARLITRDITTPTLIALHTKLLSDVKAIESVLGDIGG